MVLLAFTLPAGACWQCYHSCGAWQSASLMCAMLGGTKRLGMEGISGDCLVHSLSLSHPPLYTVTQPSIHSDKIFPKPSLLQAEQSSSFPVLSMQDRSSSPYSPSWCFTELIGELRTGCSAPDVGSQHRLLITCEPLKVSVEVVIKDCEFRRPTKFFLDLIKADSKVGKPFNLASMQQKKNF